MYIDKRARVDSDFAVDFWLDLPYLIKDLISHVIDSIMSHRRGSGGYVAV